MPPIARDYSSFLEASLERPPTLLANVERTGELLLTVLLAKIAKMPAPRARESLNTKQQNALRIQTR